MWLSEVYAADDGRRCVVERLAFRTEPASPITGPAVGQRDPSFGTTARVDMKRRGVGQVMPRLQQQHIPHGNSPQTQAPAMWEK